MSDLGEPTPDLADPIFPFGNVKRQLANPIWEPAEATRYSTNPDGLLLRREATHMDPTVWADKADRVHATLSALFTMLQVLASEQ